MKILYDRSKKTFFHAEKSILTFAFGKNSFLLSSKEPTHSYQFDLQVNNESHSIPLIGIIASKEKKNKYKGNFELFRSIQDDVERSGGLCFVFSPEDVNSDSIDGIIYNSPLKKWVKCNFPTPNVIYNRVSSHLGEQNHSYKTLLTYIQEHTIPFFNPHFFHKWEIYELLSQNSELQPYLPYTERIKDEETFNSFLKKYKKVYVKHSLASQGKGIRLIEYDSKGEIVCKSIKKIEKYPSISRFLQSYNEWFKDREQQWIIQEAVNCKTIHDHRYDFRILVLHTGTNFRLIGIGVRMSQRQEVTTHVPSGGKIISLKEVINPSTKKEISKIVKNCGKELAKSFGYVGEFSIDLAPREEGGFVLFEINSKPMIFDEIDIETKRRQQLVQTFFALSNHNKKVDS
ncbi:YheC/YheD family protein [Rossellomorea aquimaris]|uniref:YheC/YheD family protein n=1 Tax=Rossellomorea aquimaris TaxID=189382 RepID=UPI0007D0938A|nr:YheC/YheD family protein [Rossellomorea aquimaris]